MRRLRFAVGISLFLCLAVSVVDAQESSSMKGKEMPSKMIGMYVHQHWSYKHPYAARTWTLEDWHGYLDGIHRLGYNTVMVWPVLETMPNPLTESDKANLGRISKVIDMAHDDFGMRVIITLCPNVAARDSEAAKYTFEKRPFFHTDRRIDPGDPVELGKLIAWREELFKPLAKADGVSIIDSDPGGYPGSNDAEFVNLLRAHRGMLDRLRTGIALYYWIHVGWQAYCDYYLTGEFRMGKQEEVEGALKMLAKANPEPWGILSGWGPDKWDAIGLHDRVISFSYGAIEGEPTFPMTNFGGDSAWKAGSASGALGVMGNSQTHCLQIPNALAFVRGAQGKPANEADYAALANDLLVGQGEAIVAAWKALSNVDGNAMKAASNALKSLSSSDLGPGPLKGLLFGDPQRFVNDLVTQLDAKAALEDVHAALAAEPQDKVRIGESFRLFVTAIDAWQKQHGYCNFWAWERMEQALARLNNPGINAVLETRNYKGEGATPFERIQNGFSATETFTLRLIEAMKAAADEF